MIRSGSGKAATRLVRNGVVINALAIEELNYKNLTNYYRRHVVGGPEAFVITADEFEDVSTAMKAKLLREIRGRALSMRQPLPPATRDYASMPPSLSSPASSSK